LVIGRRRAEQSRRDDDGSNQTDDNKTNTDDAETHKLKVPRFASRFARPS